MKLTSEEATNVEVIDCRAFTDAVDMDRAMRAAVCPECGGGAISQSSNGFTIEGDTTRYGSGARRSRCANGHAWESAGYGEPFVVVTDDDRGGNR